MDWRRLVAAIVTVATAAAAQGLAQTVPATQMAPATQTQPAAVIDPKAQRVLREATACLAGIKAFRVTNRTTRSAIVDGQPTQRQSMSTLALERPDRFALRMEGFITETIVCDGRMLYTYRDGPKSHTYQPERQRYSVQEATAASLEKLKSRMAWAGAVGDSAASMLIADQPYDAFAQPGGIVTYVAPESVGGIACERLRLTVSFMKVDIWIRSGPQPLPVKMVSTSGGEGAPRKLRNMQMETVHILEDWWIGDTLPDETFHFEPPAGALKVAHDELIPRPGLHPMVGTMAPGMTLDLLDGGRLALSDHTDRNAVVLAFCEPDFPWSADYLAKVAELARGFSREDVRFYVVIPAESRHAMRELLQKVPVDIPVALYPRETVADQYLVVPDVTATMLIDRRGKVQVVDMRSGSGAGERLAKQIRDVLDGKDLAADAIAQEQKRKSSEPAPEPQTGPRDRQPVRAHGARPIWTLRGWFRDVAASARTGEIYALAKDPRIVVLDRQGRQHREIPLDGNPNRLRLGSQVAGEQPQIVLFRKHEPDVTAVDVVGQVLWRFDTDREVDGVCLADLDRDGHDETIISCSGRPGLQVLDSHGKLLWASQTTAHGVAAGDTDGDGYPELVLGGRWIRILDARARGKQLREIKTIPLVDMVHVVLASKERPATILACVLGDGKDRPSVLTALGADGQENWKIDLPDFFVSSVAVDGAGSWVSLALSDGVIVVDLATGRTVSRIPDRGAAVAVVPSAEGKPILLTASVSGLKAYSIE